MRLPARSHELGAASTWGDQLGAMQSPGWVVGAILTDGAWSLAQVSPVRLADAALGATAARVGVVRDDTLPAAGAVVSITHQGGATHTARRDHPLGSPARPLPRDDIIAKLDAAATALGWHDRANAVVDAVDALPHATSIAPLLRLLARPERDPAT